MLFLLLSFACVLGGRNASPAQLAADAPASVSSGPVTRGQRIFSTGHSVHFGFPAILDEIAKSAGYKDNEIIGISSIGRSIVAQDVAGAMVQEALKAGRVDMLTPPIYLPDSGIEGVSDPGIAHNPKFRMSGVDDDTK